jgi:hypothetical protein
MNCWRKGKSQSLCLFIRWQIKQTAVNYRGISILSDTYKILSYILLSRLTPNTEEINGDHQCGFGCHRSTADHIFCIHQILQKKLEYNQVVPQLFIDFKNACT